MKIVAEVSFVDEKTIRSLNRRWRKIDKATDVLSFPLDREVGPDKVMRLGDIVICKTIALKKRHSVPFLINHAMLHLLGKHHK
ncbi:rRNA maturation RNase YbeY [Candidatus Beckwithbacteria bacterium CG2_30_44_31]|uniref:rRNA maturation RNase YbeY n=1 Tax=Candidatus Beckwithbacteria bacterium CG2_30_44_31 TaxID=1805035 RepID=A0A1J5AWF6_9BACT|nr:MAG: rRNA maturation RNase YbeY [Candidatus Beckwithbacteria bacterium CG2_30_44_31]